MVGGTIAFATSNIGKLREVRDVFRPLGIRVRWSRRTLPEPQADALEDVVRAKLASICPSRTPVLVEDSGLFIESLGGFPGVYSSYAYRTIGLRGILALLDGRARAATFRTVAGLRRGRTVMLATGESRGSISRSIRGRAGFGFDPIFEPVGARRTFAELSLEEKNALSHRGRAIRTIAQRYATELLRRRGP